MRRTTISFRVTSIAIIASLSLLLCFDNVYYYRPSRFLLSLAYSPDIVNHRAIAGLWKLKQRSSSSSSSSSTFKNYPIKEFTVYPKRKIVKPPTLAQNIGANDHQRNGYDKEVLLMLKEDGSFQQYSNKEEDEETTTIPDTLKFFNKKNSKDGDDEAVLNRFFQFGSKLNGKWNLVGGKLILAADRPSKRRRDRKTSSSASEKIDDESDDDDDYDVADTILEGEVVATSEEGLMDNPVLRQQKKDDDDGGIRSDEKLPGNTEQKNKIGSSSNKKDTATSSSSVPPLDTHLSVPKGRVKTGRFFYPKHHPSFFDVPIYNPKKSGKFELKQVLGSLNTRNEDDDVVMEKFHESIFYNKTFILTSHPLPKFKPKGRQRWSIKYNKFVEDPPKSKNKEEEYEEKSLDKPMHSIRVIEVKFFRNNTFATIKGLGESTILRGKFSVIGTEKDHLWMQIMRFGFGRSVSGSVFSEGRSLTKDDEKAYWGKIQFDDVDNDDQKEDTSDSTIGDNDDNRRLVVKGSVLLGSGLEPLPVGLFVLAESTTSTGDDDDDWKDDYDDDEDDEDEINFDYLINKKFDDQDDDGDDDAGNDDFFNYDNAFQ